MYYTIAYTQDVHNRQDIEFNKAGNEYSVSFHNAETHEYTSKRYDNIKEALAVYQRYVEAFITGRYSYEDRKAWLK